MLKKKKSPEKKKVQLEGAGCAIGTGDRAPARGLGYARGAGAAGAGRGRRGRAFFSCGLTQVTQRPQRAARGGFLPAPALPGRADWRARAPRATRQQLL